MNNLDAQDKPAAAATWPLPPAADADVLLKQMEMEIILRRTKRLAWENGAGKSLRLLGILLALTVVCSAIFAVWYLQARYQGANHRRTAAPTHAASDSDVP